MNAEKFVRDAWATTDQEARKLFVRAHVTKVALPELEKVVLRELDRAGWNVGILMVAQRILQVVPSERIMHGLLAMASAGAASIPNGATLHKQLQANLDHLASRHPALADAEKSFRKANRGAAKAAKAKVTPTKGAPTKAATAVVPTPKASKPAVAAKSAKPAAAAKAPAAKPAAAKPAAKTIKATSPKKAAAKPAAKKSAKRR